MSLVPIASPYDSVISTLTANVGFADSQEYQIAAKNGYDLPGVIASAYARYIAQSSRSSTSESYLTEIMKPVNKLASYHDSQVDVLLMDELFEQIEAERCIDSIRSFMSIDLASLWDSWCEKELKS